MLLAALALVYEFGTKTFPEADEFWALYDAGSGIHLDWMWKFWAEHRIPLAKFIWKGVLQLTDYDFRFGNFLTVFAMAGVAFAMLWVARRIRGRTIVADAFFPLALLNFGQSLVFLWWWQVNHVLAPITACMLLLILVLSENSMGVGTAILMGAGLVLLGVCGPGGLPYILVLGVWLLVWIATYWSGLAKRQRRYVLFVMVLIGISLLLVGAYFVNYTPYFPQNNPTNLFAWPSSPSPISTILTGLQILGLSLGTATKAYAPYWGLGILLLMLVAVRVLVSSWLSAPEVRLRTLGLLMFLCAPVALVVVISQSRAGMGLDYIYSGHYLTHMLPMLCSLYFILEFSGKSWGRAVQFLMLIVLIGLLPFNFRRGPEVGKYIQQKATAFERDIDDGVPSFVLAERHFASDLLPCMDKVILRLKAYKDNGIGIFTQMHDDPVFRIVKSPTEPDTVTGAIWQNGVTSKTDSTGGESSLKFVLSKVQYIYAIRLHYTYLRTDNSWLTLRMFWRNSGKEDFTNRIPEVVGRKLVSITPGPDQPHWALVDGKIKINATIRTERVLTAWVDRTIDQFLIYPEFGNFEFRLSEIELLIPLNPKTDSLD